MEMVDAFFLLHRETRILLQTDEDFGRIIIFVAEEEELRSAP